MAHSKVFVPGGDGMVPLTFERLFEHQSISGAERITVSSDGAWRELMVEIAWLLADRCTCRYEEREANLAITSLPLDRRTVEQFFKEWERFLESDPRHNVSLRTQDCSTTVTLDEHNFIHVNGRLDGVDDFLESRGYSEGRIMLPTPHLHQDLSEFDEAANWFKETLSKLT